MPRLGDPFISQNPRSFYVSFFRTDSRLCIYHLFLWSNFSLLHSSQWITLPTRSFLVLYSFCDNLLYSLNMSLIVSSLSPHNQLFCTPCKFFTPTSPRNFSLGSERHHVNIEIWMVSHLFLIFNGSSLFPSSLEPLNVYQL